MWYLLIGLVVVVVTILVAIYGYSHGAMSEALKKDEEDSDSDA